jgi:predicted ATPase
VGKSRLLRELLELAEDGGYLTLSGRAAQFERDVPFAVFIDALDGYLAAQHPRDLEALGADHLRELARVFPSLDDPINPGVGAGQSERHLAHYAVRALLDLLAGRRPLVLALDDLQWADEASLELASFLLRRPPSGRELLAVAYRPGELPGRLAEAVKDALGSDRLDLVEVGPLAPAEVDELLGDSVDAGARARLHAESGGNPFYLEQLRRWLGADAEPADGDQLVGEIAQYEDSYRLCFMRGPEGIIIGLAEQLGVVAP